MANKAEGNDERFLTKANDVFSSMRRYVTKPPVRKGIISILSSRVIIHKMTDNMIAIGSVSLPVAISY